MFCFSDDSVNQGNCTQYNKSTRYGGTGRKGLINNLLHHTDKHPKKNMGFFGGCSGNMFGVKFVQGLMNSRIYQRMQNTSVFPNSRIWMMGPLMELPGSRMGPIFIETLLLWTTWRKHLMDKSLLWKQTITGEGGTHGLPVVQTCQSWISQSGLY